MIWKCKGYDCQWYEGCNVFGNAPICGHMVTKLKRMVMVRELRNCDNLKVNTRLITPTLVKQKEAIV